MANGKSRLPANFTCKHKVTSIGLKYDDRHAEIPKYWVPYIMNSHLNRSYKCDEAKKESIKCLSLNWSWKWQTTQFWSKMWFLVATKDRIDINSIISQVEF